MHKVMELLLPSWAEAALYWVLGLLTLVALNAGGLWHLVLNASGTDSATAKSIDEGFRDLISRTTTLSDPQLVNAVVWGATAGLGVCITVAIIGFVRSTNEDAHARSGLERIAVRIISLLAVVLSTALTVFVLLPTFSYEFMSRTTHLIDSWTNTLIAVVAITGVGLCFYALAVLCRLLVLRIRVFSTVVE